MDEEITCIPGLEGVIRSRDLPTQCRYGDRTVNPILDFFVGETEATRRVSHLIINTVDELEGLMISKLYTIFPHVYTVGPLHGLVNELDDSRCSTAVEKQCMKWLDAKPQNSVMYVSFGSIARLEEGEFLEIWQGLVNSGKPFLWVLRRDLVSG
ncbi:7-deoxyloganetic acid glucosyl transferase, partial [Linum grandiflorum]